MLEKKLQGDLVEAMKEHRQERIDAIRAIKSSIQIEKTKGTVHELNDDDVIKIISKLSKQYQEDIVQYQEAGRNDLIEKSQREKDIFDSYLPQMLSNDEVSKYIDKFIRELNATTMKNMGEVMARLKKEIPNRYDPKFASAYIKEKLSK